MKKVLFVLAFVAVYGVSMAITTSNVVSIDETVVVVADLDDNEEKEEGKKAAKAKGEKPTEGCSETKAKAEGCSGEKSAAKAEGCSGEKSAKKSDCSSSCAGKK